METQWAKSTQKHGIPRADAVNATRHPPVWLAQWDAPRVAGGIRPDLFIGPSVDGQTEIEVMAEVEREGGRIRSLFVFHVMPARSTTRARARAIHEERKKR